MENRLNHLITSIEYTDCVNIINIFFPNNSLEFFTVRQVKYCVIEVGKYYDS